MESKIRTFNFQIFYIIKVSRIISTVFQENKIFEVLLTSR